MGNSVKFVNIVVCFRNQRTLYSSVKIWFCVRCDIFLWFEGVDISILVRNGDILRIYTILWNNSR